MDTESLRRLLGLIEGARSDLEEHRCKVDAALTAMDYVSHDLREALEDRSERIEAGFVYAVCNRCGARFQISPADRHIDHDLICPVR